MRNNESSKASKAVAILLAAFLILPVLPAGCLSAFAQTPERAHARLQGAVGRSDVGINVNEDPAILGSGTEQDPYVIYKASGLRWLSEQDDGGSTGCMTAFVRLANDLDLTDGGKAAWTPIGKNGQGFGGVLDGCGHTVDLYINNENGAMQGLFGYLTGTVRNLNVRGTVIADNMVGGIAGSCCGTIENCSFSGTVKGEQHLAALFPFICQ